MSKITKFLNYNPEFGRFRLNSLRDMPERIDAEDAKISEVKLKLRIAKRARRDARSYEDNYWSTL